MRRAARARRRCRRCPFCAPSGRCLERTIKSGRCGDWIWFMRYGKQIRRRYVRPHDPCTPAQIRSRDRLSAASRKYSYSLTEKQQDARIAAGARLRSRPRLVQSGPLTGQQYSIHRQYALQKAHGNGIKTAIAPQVHQPQKLKRTTWEPRRGVTGAPPSGHGAREPAATGEGYPVNLPSRTRRSTGSAASRERPRSTSNSATQSLCSSGSTNICWTRQVRLSSAGTT